MPTTHPLPVDARLLQRAIEQSSNLLVVTDVDARIVYVNPRFTEVTGYTFDEVLGQNPRILQSGRTPRATYEAMWAALSTVGHWRGEFENRCKDGHVYRAEAALSAVRDAAGQVTHYLGVQTDVTEARRTAEALAALSADLEARVDERTADLNMANRHLEAVNRELEAFTHTLVHDVRRHLRTVGSFAAILSDDLGPKLDAEDRRLLDGIEAGCARLDQVISALGKLSRVQREVPQRRAVDASEVVRAILAEALDDGVERRVEVEPEMTVDADPVLLRLALENLVENALKYTATVPSPVIRIHRASRSPHTLVVRDNGIGFNAEQAEDIFRPFGRLPQAKGFPGDGLGLATVRRIAERHGGAAWAEPGPERGATFYLRLAPTDGPTSTD
ncbi:MAG: PAS domain S-box protein [Myxococcales bacterium]|nr:PAS domain S-box protein [Myxococcales bacterium]